MITGELKMISIITVTPPPTSGLLSTILLIGLLITKELSDASTWKNAEKLSKNTAHAIVPLLFVFCTTVFRKVIEVM